MNGIDTNEQRYLQTTLHVEPLQAIGLFEREHMEERRHQSAARPLFHVLHRNAWIERVGRVGGQFFGAHRGRILLKMLNAHKLVHLPNLFFEGHASQKVVYALRHTGLRIFIKWLFFFCRHRLKC